jgi:hypothetical protein
VTRGGLEQGIGHGTPVALNEVEGGAGPKWGNQRAAGCGVGWNSRNSGGSGARGLDGTERGLWPIGLHPV